MPDLEELIRRTLLARHADAPVSANLLVGARTRRRRRRTGLAVAGVAVATAAAVVTPIAVISHGRSTATGPGPTAPASSPPTSTAAPGGPDNSMFTAAAPMLGLMIIGPIPAQQPNCTPEQINARAELKRSTYGVIGVVTMHGQHCSIPMYPGPSALVDAAGQPLDIPVAAGDQIGENIRPDLAFAAGDAAWGFAWTGSWCGMAPAGVVLPLTGKPNSDAGAEPSLTVPITGPTLGCSGTSDSTLVRGAPGRIGEPVLPPPAAWSSLTATLGRVETAPVIEPFTVTLTNDSDNDVIFDPCPQFRVVVDYEYSQATDGGLFPCDTAPGVPAHGKVTVNLPPLSLGDDDSRNPTSATLTFGIAGGVTTSIDLSLK